MMTKTAKLIASVATWPEADARSLPVEADAMEWRADLLGHHAPLELAGFAGDVIYSLRSAAEGGSGPSEPGARRRALIAAAQRFDLVELEGERDLEAATLAAIPAERRVIAWRGEAAGAGELRARLGRFIQARAAWYCFATRGRGLSAGLVPVEFLAALGRRDVVAFAEEEEAAWTRALAARFGAPIVYGGFAAGGKASPASLGALVQDYGLPRLDAATELCAIVGGAIEESPSPALHNAAYRAQRLARIFLRLPVASFAGFWEEVMLARRFERLGLPLQGLTVASPHKKSVLTVAEEISEVSRRAESANVLYRGNGKWCADTTDAAGVLMNAEPSGGAWAGRRVAVIGCGGSGRPIAAALHGAGARVTLVNRSAGRGRWAAELLGLPFVPLAELSCGEQDVIINATPVGRGGEELPLELGEMRRGSLVVDLVYTASATPLCMEGRRRGHEVIDGRAILLAQAARQYRLMTGEEMPRETRGQLPNSVEIDFPLAIGGARSATSCPATSAI